MSLLPKIVITIRAQGAPTGDKQYHFHAPNSVLLDNGVVRLKAKCNQIFRDAAITVGFPKIEGEGLKCGICFG